MRASVRALTNEGSVRASTNEGSVHASVRTGVRASDLFSVPGDNGDILGPVRETDGDRVALRE